VDNSDVVPTAANGYRKATSRPPTERERDGGEVMLEYINKVKRGLIEQYGFPESTEFPGCVSGHVPDGDYPMTIDGKTDNVQIIDGKIHCCKFESRSK
jgi:hypothetical protein